MGRALRIGLYSPFFGTTIGGGEKYLGVTAEAVRDAFPRHQVEIVSPVPVDRDRYERMLKLDLSGIELISTNPRVTKLHHLLGSMRVLRLYRDLFISAQTSRFTRRYDLFLSMVYVLPAFSQARLSILLCQFPYPLGGIPRRKGLLVGPLFKLYVLPYRLLKPLVVKSELDAFREIICQSEYVRHWVAAFWQRDSMVINPPIDVPEQAPDLSRKEKLILSVGRFFAVGHSKRHDVMIQAFRQLCDEGLDGWELHLAGSVHREPHNAGYFPRIEEFARGYPIYLHPDASYECVQDLYQRASIYWHAAGHGVDAARDPISLEHFGMTTAEAMAHGVVPVAIARGGQPEVVRDGLDGFLWNRPHELTQRTLELISNPDLRIEMAERAREASLRFSRAEFKRRMSNALQPFVRELEGSAGQAETT